MILLDTNVVSEAMKPEPAPAVRAWLDAQAAETLYLSSVTIAELMFGIGALPRGRRKDKLTAVLDGVLELFGTESCRSIPVRPGATPNWPAGRVPPEKASPRPTATSPRSPPRMISPWHPATPAPSRPPASP